MAKAVQRDVSFSSVFIVLFGETLAFFFMTLTTLFLGFHIYLMLSAMTTIEFCEKALPKKAESSGDYTSMFWLVPFVPPPGDGCTYPRNTGAPLGPPSFE